METSKMKNIVVLKDLPSNIVEEAIVVLKNNKKIKKPELIKNKNNNDKTKQDKSKKIDSKDYIIKEAQMLIANYISEIEKNNQTKKSQKNLQKKYNRIKKINEILIAVSFFSILAFLMK